MCLFKCITGLVSEKPIAVNVLTSPKTRAICRKELLSYFFVLLSQIELEKVIFNQIWDLGLLDNTLTANYEYFSY